MKGYKMVLLVNGGLFLFIALSGYLLGNVLEADAARCVARDPENPRCAQTADAATTAFRVGPILAVAGVLLLVLGFVLGKPKEGDAEPLGAATASRSPTMVHDWTKALRDSPQGLMIDVEVVPNSSSPGFPVGFNPWRNRIQARVAAEPEDGRANEELISLVAAALMVPRDHVAITEGHTSRRKRIAVRGVSAAEFTRRVAEALGE